MKKSFASKILIALLIVVMVFPKLDIPVLAGEDPSTDVIEYNDEGSSKTTLIRGTTEPSFIDKYGNVYLSITSEEFFGAGYEYGDIVKVKILGKKHRLPVVSSYTDVDSGKPALLAREDKPYIWLALNMGSFATEYGLATKTTFEDGTFEWNYPEGISGPLKVSVWMNKKGGYADEYAIHQLTSSNEKNDYPNLTDEEFANFRDVNTTGMGFGILYRTSSPVDPENNRNVYADKAIRDAGVTVMLNLTDTPESVKEYEGFSDTYYSTIKSLELPFNVDYKSEEFEQMLAKVLRFMAENPGVYAINCKTGKDRAGYVVAILECLMGAEYYEVVDDYMISYYNYYGIKSGDPAYDAIVKGNVEKTLKSAFTFTRKDKKKDLSTRNLSKCAKKYLKKIGLTGSEIRKLKKNLSKSVAAIERNVPVKNNGEIIGSVKLNFYREQPNIPYIGIKYFYNFLKYDLSYRTDKQGRTVLSNKNGIEAVFDPVAGTISSDNWEFFNRKIKSEEEKDSSFVGTKYWFTHEIVFDSKETGRTATFDLKKYGLKMIEDDKDIYLSLSLVSNLWAEPNGDIIGWNGKYVFWDNITDNGHFNEIYESDTIKNMLEKKERPQDIADETFKELCFIMDNFYGHPSSALLADSIKENGFYQTMLESGEDVMALFNGLQSTDTAEYYSSLIKLFSVYLDDKGHTLLFDIWCVVYYKLLSLIEPAQSIELLNLFMQSGYMKSSSLHYKILDDGKSFWGENLYLEYDNTAIIKLTDFSYDEEGWKKYFQEEGELPMDAAGITVSGLRKASENPKIENIIFDLSANLGGYTDILGFISGITSGNNVIRAYNEVNDWTPERVIEIDTNLDGVIDEEDKNIYDGYNYGVLTTKAAFSCGNEFPFMMRDGGAVVIGEPSGGGSCTLIGVVQPDGTVFTLSSSYNILIQENGQDVESGCDVDVPIMCIETVNADGSIIYDYSTYFDIEKLDKIMDEWFN